MPNIVFAHVTGAAKFCLGASTAVRRSDLEKFGGLEVLGDYLVEDFEMGRRIWESGKRPVVLPYLVDTTVDLRTLPEWWRHQVYWDQNNRAARPGGYFATVLLRSVPFALLYAVSQTDYGLGLGVLGASIALRLSTAAVILRWGLHDREGLRSLGLLVLRDILALVSFLLAYTKRRTVWRGAEFTLTRDGRIVERRTGA
jgi:ceramide glucosyltransferase